MKLSRLNPILPLTAAALALVGIGAVARGADTNSLAPAGKTNSATATATGTNSTAVATNSGPVELPVPLAIFDLAAKPTHDPFFPNSLRQPIPAVTTNTAPAFSASSFTLKGLSGSAGLRLALINNRTLAEGENAEITTASGKIKIHCVKINDASVVIRAESQADLLEIFLRKGAQ